MGTTPSGSDSPSSSPARPDLDFVLPEIDECPPIFPDQTLAQVYARNAEVMRETVYDEEYFAKSLARKVTEPFVM
jgi:hypothetical protein